MAKRQRRVLQVFNMSFLDMILNLVGALIILLLISMKNVNNRPCPEIKYNTTAHLDSLKNIIWDTLSWRNLKIKDRVLVTIEDYQPLRSEKCSPCFPQKVCNRRHYPDATPCVCAVCPDEKGGCSIVGVATSGECMNDGTYTATIIVRSAGRCGVGWKDNLGHTGIYDRPTTATFKASDGNKVLYATDSEDSKRTCRVNVFPPKCTPPTPGGGGGSPSIGEINFKMTWKDANARINLYVESGGKWCTANRGQKFGYIEQAKIMKDPFTGKYLGEEQFIQADKVIPGTYKIYAHYKGVQDKKQNTPQKLTVSLNVSSKSHPELNDIVPREVSLQDNSPRSSGGGTYLATVVVSADGSIKFQ